MLRENVPVILPQFVRLLLLSFPHKYDMKVFDKEMSILQ